MIADASRFSIQTTITCEMAAGADVAPGVLVGVGALVGVGRGDGLLVGVGVTRGVGVARGVGLFVGAGVSRAAGVREGCAGAFTVGDGTADGAGKCPATGLAASGETDTAPVALADPGAGRAVDGADDDACGGEPGPDVPVVAAVAATSEAAGPVGGVVAWQAARRRASPTAALGRPGFIRAPSRAWPPLASSSGGARRRRPNDRRHHTPRSASRPLV